MNADEKIEGGNTVLLAAKTFTASGKLEMSLFWEEERELVMLQ
jgi:hypothetical protein